MDRRTRQRDGVVIVTKVAQQPERPGLSASNVAAAVEDSLRRLRTDHVDVYDAHQEDPDTELEESAARGHQVASVSRTRPETLPDGVSHSAGDATDQQFLQDLLSATDRVVLALSPRGPREGKAREFADLLIPIAAAAGVREVIGGAGFLRVAPGGPRGRHRGVPRGVSGRNPRAH